MTIMTLNGPNDHVRAVGIAQPKPMESNQVDPQCLFFVTQRVKCFPQNQRLKSCIELVS